MVVPRRRRRRRVDALRECSLVYRTVGAAAAAAAMVASHMACAVGASRQRAVCHLLDVN